METNKTTLTVKTTINAPVKQVWACWTEPEHVMQWNHASQDWHCPAAANDLRPGGSFRYTMAAKDASISFDFSGAYTEVIPCKVLKYTMDDGRKVEVIFSAEEDRTQVVEYFEAETTHPHEMQTAGWQAILDRFKEHTEKQANN